MLHWIETHGIEAILAYVVVLLIAGTVPPLSPSAGFWAKWVYGLLKAVSFNARGIGNALGIKVPELNLETGVTMVKKQPALTEENK